MTLNRGTNATGVTRSAENVVIMNGVHLAQAGIIGKNVIIVNLLAKSGNREINDWAFLEG